MTIIQGYKQGIIHEWRTKGIESVLVSVLIITYNWLYNIFNDK